jgi:hypothetical protein
VADFHLGQVGGCHRIDECLDLLQVHVLHQIATVSTAGARRKDGMSLPR